MDFRIADTFTDSLARLTGEEQKAVKTAAFDLQVNPASPSMSFHKLAKAKDKNFWSVRVGSDIRLIVHKNAASLLLCYVDHHDKAYHWAERRKLETHPTTGAAQLVEIRETIKEITVPVYVQSAAATSKPALFTSKSDEELLSYGVPPQWLNDVRQANEDSVLDLAEHLPSEAAEALLELATGGRPRAAHMSAEQLNDFASQLPTENIISGTGAPLQNLSDDTLFDSRPVRTRQRNIARSNNYVSENKPTAYEADPFQHPDAQRRFRTISNVAELQQALDFPWEKWTVFLHPDQRQLVERAYTGPARVAGSAGTGKTIVALHRAAHLARKNADARILLTTFSDTLANALHTKLRRLVGSEPRLAERIDVHSLDAIGLRLYKTQVGQANIANHETIRGLMHEASDAVGGHKFGMHFLLTEWEQVVDAWRLSTWDEYRDVARLGRKTRLPEAQRFVLWAIFEHVRAALLERRLITRAELFTTLASTISKTKNPPFDFAVVDEAQDISVSHLRFFAALGGNRPDALFFAGDLGQRIFQQPFSWKSLGVDVRGRSRTLRVNYRTSHQIRTQADRLLAPVMTDVDGNAEDRSDTISVFNGVAPVILTLKDESAEIKAVGSWIVEKAKAGVLPHEIGVFVRSPAQLDRAQAAVNEAGLTYKILDEHVETVSGHVSISTMHLAKGLEFRAVVVMACDDEIVPLQERIETVGDDSDLREVYDTERHLLYVACTRARDHLLVTSVEPASEFLDDMRQDKKESA